MSKRNPPGDPVVADPHEVNVQVEEMNKQIHAQQAFHQQIQRPTMPGEEGTIDGRSSGPKSVLEAVLPDGTVDRTIVPSAHNAPLTHADHTPWSKADEAGLVPPGAQPEGEALEDLKDRVEKVNPDGAPDAKSTVAAVPAKQGPAAAADKAGVAQPAAAAPTGTAAAEVVKK